MSESTSIQRSASGWRFVQTRHGDTLQAIAFRELGDASRWAELAHLNDLVPPYLTDDEALALAKLGRVKVYGQTIRVFAPVAVADAAVAPEEVYGTDLALVNGRLAAEHGDFATVSGLSNLSSAIQRRIETERGELLFHADYGCDLQKKLGQGNSMTTAALTTRDVRLGLAGEDRIDRLLEVRADISGDSCEITLRLTPVGQSEILSITTEA